MNQSINQSINHLFDSDHLRPYTQNTDKTVKNTIELGYW